MSPGAALQPSRTSDTIDLTGAPPRGTTIKQQMTAIVKLNSIDTDDKVGCRRLVLTTDRPIYPIGRASSKKAGLEGRITNAYFENAVISRVHAELRLDLSGLRVMLADRGSLHGTWHNDTRLKVKETRALRTGDTITLGAPIERGQDKFQPYKIRAEITWEMPSTDKPVTWTVPDDTDVEDMEEDGGNDTDLGFARSVLLENGFEAPCSPDPTEAASTSHGQAGTVVDLTTDEEPTSAPITTVSEEPDLYSDDRVPVIKDVSPGALWYSENEDNDSEDLYTDEWGLTTESGDLDGGDGCSSCNSDGTNELDLDGEPTSEAYPESSAASIVEAYESDDAVGDWEFCEDLVCTVNHNTSNDPAPDHCAGPTTALQLDQASLPSLLPEVTHTDSLEQNPWATRSYEACSLSDNFAPSCFYRGGENAEEGDKVDSSTSVPLRDLSSKENLRLGERSSQTRQFFSKILADVDPITTQPTTQVPEPPSRKRAADMISSSTAREEEIVAQADNAGGKAEKVLAERSTPHEEPSHVPQTKSEPAQKPIVPAQKPTVPAHTSSARNGQHSAKRIRRSVAEAAGYVALGGVLAWSALVATAPVL